MKPASRPPRIAIAPAPRSASRVTTRPTVAGSAQAAGSSGTTSRSERTRAATSADAAAACAGCRAWTVKGGVATVRGMRPASLPRRPAAKGRSARGGRASGTPNRIRTGDLHLERVAS